MLLRGLTLLTENCSRVQNWYHICPRTFSLSFFEKAICLSSKILMFLSAIWSSLCFSSLMYRFILPLVVFVPHDSNVAVDTQVWFRSSKWISSVAGISKMLCTSEVASATRTYVSVRHLRLSTKFSYVVCIKWRSEKCVVSIDKNRKW